MKNRIFATLAVAGLVGLAACDSGEDTVVEQPVVEEPAPVVVEPAPAPMMSDTMVHDTLGHDTAAAPR